MPAPNLTAIRGEAVVLRCAVKAGHPPPAVVWERDTKQPLNSSSDGILVISPVTFDNEGMYICKASNIIGSTEAVALLTVQGNQRRRRIQTPESSEQFFFKLEGRSL